MDFSFIADGQEIRLPVSPVPFGWGAGQQARELTVNGAGTVYWPGDPMAHSGSLECMFPARDYPFNTPGALTDPYYYVDVFTRWAREKAIVRYVVPGCINCQVIVEEIVWEERDGTGDVYATIYLKEYQALEAVITESGGSGQTGNSGRTPAESGGGGQTYTVVSGDCLSVICRRFYGNGTSRYYNALAAYNGISNPHLIFPGQVLTIPTASQLGL